MGKFAITVIGNKPYSQQRGSIRESRSGSAKAGRASSPSDLTGSIIGNMNVAAKLIAAMRQNPRDWRIAELQTVARQHGIDWRHQKSSHCVFIRDDGRTLSVRAHRPIKPIYLQEFIELVDGA